MSSSGSFPLRQAQGQDDGGRFFAGVVGSSLYSGITGHTKFLDWFLVQCDVIGPWALRCGIVGGAQAGEGLEVVGEVGLVVVAAGEGEFGPVDVGAAVEELDGLLEALDAAVEFGGDADLLAELLGETARAEADVAGEGGDGGGAGGLLEAGEGVVDGGGTALGFAFVEAVAEGEVEEIEFARDWLGFAEIVAEILRCAAPEDDEVGFAVGEQRSAFGEEGCGAAGAEEDADEFAEVDGVDLLVMGVDAEEEGGGGVLERVGGVVRVGEVVAGERDDDLGVTVGEDAFVAVGRSGVAGVPEGFDVGGEGGVRGALEVEHASTSCWGPSHIRRGLWGRSYGCTAIVGQ